MATDLKSHAQGVSLTRFFGGDDRGVCVQVTTKKREPQSDFCSYLCNAEFFDSVQLTRAQAAALAADLLDFAQNRETIDLG
jgi:hypothetical protein